MSDDVQAQKDMVLHNTREYMSWSYLPPIKPLPENMAEYDVGVTLQVVIEADSKEEAEDIAIKNIQNCLDPYYIEADADEN